MSVTFEMRSPPGEDADGKPLAPIEYVRIELAASAIINRAVKEVDRRRYRTEYEAFKAAATPPPAPVTPAAPVAPAPTAPAAPAAKEEPKAKQAPKVKESRSWERLAVPTKPKKG